MYFINCVSLTGSISLVGSIAFAVDSDLNGPSPQFHLTCISTGGIPTNVTWTRNETTIDISVGLYNTVLTDGLASTYNNTLTVKGRMAGVYSCILAGATGRISGQLNVQGKYSIKAFFNLEI